MRKYIKWLNLNRFFIMKRLLFSAYISNINDMLFCENLIRFLSFKSYYIHIVCNKKMELSVRNVQQVSHCRESKCELVLAYNRLGLRRTKCFLGQIPIFYFCFGYNYYHERVNIYEYDKLFIIGSNRVIIEDNSYSILNILFDEAYDNFDKNKIVVAVNNIVTINGLLPFLNMIYTQRFDILCVNEVFRFVSCNPNIRIIKKQNDIIESFRSASVIIGEGQSVIKGILMEKPVLVLGDYGYGGLVNMNNIDLFWKNGFLGRIGGAKGEYLPFELIQYDIVEAFKVDRMELKKIRVYIGNVLTENYNAFSEEINRFVALYDDVNEIKLLKNKLYSIVSQSAKQVFYLTNIITNQIICELNKEEVAFIEFFEEANCISNFFARNPMIRIKDKTIRDLLLLKVLVYEA